MKFSEIKEQGRVVKGVNTTADVSPNEITKQAAKLGFTVDRDGRPPQHSKKVKGSKTNVLFNLGLAEGIKLRLERDDEIDVLHIMDTNDKHRIEVRGKKGYESGNYDADDKLHQVLDSVGKAANISELINGEVVSINPKHPQGPDAIKTAKDVLQTESTNENSKKVNLTNFVQFCKQQLELDTMPSIKFVSNTEDTTFGYFNVDDKKIVVQLKDRHQMDIMRTVAHELVHFKQDQTYNRELDGSDGSYDENEANALAGVILRRWGQSNPALFTEAKEIASSTEIYVDMDGVLADFFTEWATLMGVEHFTQINKEFDIDTALQKIRDTENFWLDLPLTSNAKNLLNIIKDLKGSYTILSSPLPGDKNCEQHKREWIENNLSFFPPKEVLIRHDKESFATQQDGTPNILIDDYGVNIQKWEASGGVGFKHKDHKFERTASAIKQHMQEPVTEAVPGVAPPPPQLRPKNFDQIVARYKTKQPSALAELIKKFAPNILIMIAAAIGLAHLSFLQKFLIKQGINFSRKQMQKAMAQVESIEENFADGKKKGKSRPGRVKRSGASCNGSVTELRRKAKNASGEKAKMYHWCANMKSGRQK